MKRKANDEYSISAKRNINYIVDTFCDGKQVVFCERTGLTKGSVSQYCSGSNVPNNKTAKRIADTFGVNPAWVMGFDVPMSPDKLTLVADGKTIKSIAENIIINRIKQSLDNTEANLVNAYRALDEEGKEFILKIIEHETSRVNQIANAYNELKAAHYNTSPDPGEDDSPEKDKGLMDETE